MRKIRDGTDIRRGFDFDHDFNLLFTNSGDKTNKTFLGLQREVFNP